MTTDNKEPGIEVEKPTEAEKGKGIEIERKKAEIPPPLPEGEEVVAEEEVAAKKVIGKIPIHPAVVKPPLRLEGNVLAQLTGFPGWIYTEEELDAIAELITECGWEMDPRIQIILALGTLHGVKFMAMRIWQAQGRPGDLRRKKETGVVEREEKPGEEIKA